MFSGKIKRNINNGFLTKNNLKIAKYILNNYELGLLSLSIKELAYNCSVSPAAITRFCNKMNLSGYKGFSNQVSAEMNNDTNALIANDMQSIIRTKSLISGDRLESLAKVINKNKRVKLYASGFALYTAQNFKRQLNKINIKTDLVDVYDIANIYPDDDVHLFISFSGENKNFIKVIKKLKSFNEKIKLFSITSTSFSDIKKIVLEHIHGSVYTSGDIKYEKELPTSSSRVMHYILDNLFKKVYLINKVKNDLLIESIK